jgi:hypothetical protein
VNNLRLTKHILCQESEATAKIGMTIHALRRTTWLCVRILGSIQTKIGSYCEAENSLLYFLPTELYIAGELFHLPVQLCCRLSVCASSAVASLAALFVTLHIFCVCSFTDMQLLRIFLFLWVLQVNYFLC